MNSVVVVESVQIGNQISALEKVDTQHQCGYGHGEFICIYCIKFTVTPSSPLSLARLSPLLPLSILRSPHLLVTKRTALRVYRWFHLREQHPQCRFNNVQNLLPNSPSLSLYKLQGDPPTGDNSHSFTPRSFHPQHHGRETSPSPYLAFSLRTSLR
jgi:hypothetical protein